MDETEFLEVLVTKVGGSFVEIKPNHFRISHIPEDLMKRLAKDFGDKCLIEYVGEDGA